MSKEGREKVLEALRSVNTIYGVQEDITDTCPCNSWRGMMYAMGSDPDKLTEGSDDDFPFDEYAEELSDNPK